MRFFFSTAGLHNPALAMRLPEHMAIPITNECAGGLDLDYSALLLAEQFVIDKTMYEQIVSREYKALAPMAHSLSRLHEANLLVIEDMGAIIATHQRGIERKVAVLLEHPQMWLDEVRDQWRELEKDFCEFSDLYGSPSRRDENRAHFGIENWLASIEESDNNELREKALRLLKAKRKKLSEEDIIHLRGLLKFILTQVVCTDLLRHLLGAPFLNWDDAQGYYDRLYASRWEVSSNEMEVIKQSRALLSFVIPELKPRSIEQVIEFVRDEKAVRSMREELLGCVNEGITVSREWFARYINEVFRRELASQSVKRRFRWLGSAIGILLPGASLAQEIAVETGTEATESLFGRQKAKYRWYYALQRISKERTSAGSE